MTYLMSKIMYWKYITDFKLTHQGLIEYLNQTLNLRGTIEAVEILEG